MCAQFGVREWSGKASPPAMPVHRAHKEAHREKLSESCYSFQFECAARLVGNAEFACMLAAVRQWIRNGLDSVRSTSGTRNIHGHETAFGGGPEMHV